MLRAAGRRIERVLDDRAAKSRVSGMAELSLVVGIATWSGRQMPVLLYPVDVERRGDSVTTGTTIRFTGRVHLNSAFVNEMRNGGVELDERDLFDGSHYATGSPETSTVFSAITNLATQVFGDFAIERHIVIGCFFDPFHADAAGEPAHHRRTGPGPDGQHTAGCAGRVRERRGCATQ